MDFGSEKKAFGLQLDEYTAMTKLHIEKTKVQDKIRMKYDVKDVDLQRAITEHKILEDSEVRQLNNMIQL